ncbi:MAG TPA: tRNA-(ms[2]io[6]A)-hydroxylase [Gemmataceae bacterium]|jgi:tRNA-(ms[2]io[6]A)-hydroxylase
MLSLHAPTPDRWLAQVAGHLDELLIDHAHCEKKAAGVAMSLLFTYADDVPLCRAMADIVQEELDHFRLVLDLLDRRGIRFRRQQPARYAERLAALIARDEPRRAVDRLLVAALIEARSCERFGLLRDRLPDPELSAFFGGLFESEARHHSTYVRLAKAIAAEADVTARLHELAAAEARIMAEGDAVPRMHS